MDCISCGRTGHLKPITYDLPVMTKEGKFIVVTLDAVNCTHCGQDNETPEITEQNNEIIAAAMR